MSMGQLKEWFYEYFLRTHLEGIERLKRAWKGINFHSIYRNQLTWKERAIEVLTGVILTIFPFINLVIWKFWETFGNPEILTEPYRAGEDAPPRLYPIPLPPIQIQVPEPTIVAKTVALTPPPQAAAPIAEAGPQPRIETMQYTDKIRGKIYPSDWILEFFPDMTLIFKVGEENKITTRYDTNWHLQEYDYVAPDGGHLHAKLEGRILNIVGFTAEGVRREAHHELKKDYPWVQQVTFDLINFVRSTDQTFHFYGLNPKEFTMMEVNAKKIRIEEVEGFGRLLKVEVRLAGFLSFIWRAEIWLDPETGILQKMLSSPGPFAPVTETLHVQNGL